MDPRISRTQTKVRQSALTVLAERGYAGFSIEAVAAHSKVAKSTIYRHWPTGLDVIVDALETLNIQPTHNSMHGTSRMKVEQLLTHFAHAFGHSFLSKCMPALVEAAERHEQVAQFFHQYSAKRRQILVDTIQQGVESGELRVGLDPELAALALSGPIIYQRLMTSQPFSEKKVHALVELVLGA